MNDKRQPMADVCRLCLKCNSPQKGAFISISQRDNNGVTISNIVKTLVPQLFLGLSVNPKICPACYDSLRDAYSFRLQCLRSENLIGIYLRETHCSTATIRLQDVVNYWKSVYNKKNSQWEVAKANLTEWFGLEVDDRRSPPSNVDDLANKDKVVIIENDDNAKRGTYLQSCDEALKEQQVRIDSENSKSKESSDSKPASEPVATDNENIKAAEVLDANKSSSSDTEDEPDDVKINDILARYLEKRKKLFSSPETDPTQEWLRETLMPLSLAKEIKSNKSPTVRTIIKNILPKSSKIKAIRSKKELGDDDKEKILQGLIQSNALEKLGLPKDKLKLEKTCSINKVFDPIANCVKYVIVTKSPQNVEEEDSVSENTSSVSVSSTPATTITTDTSTATASTIPASKSDQTIVIEDDEEKVKTNDNEAKMDENDEKAPEEEKAAKSTAEEDSNNSVLKHIDKLLESNQKLLDENEVPPVEAISMEPSTSKAMPKIRVRPFSAMQNPPSTHEVFVEGAPRTSPIEEPETSSFMNVLAPAEQLLQSEGQPLMPVRAPIVLNSQVGQSMLKGTTQISPSPAPVNSQIWPQNQFPMIKPIRTYSKPVSILPKVTIVDPARIKQAPEIDPLRITKIKRIKCVRKVVPLVRKRPRKKKRERDSGQPKGKILVDESAPDPLDRNDATKSPTTEGERTRSASETSLMETLADNGNLSNLVDDISDIEHDIFDVPEYIHISEVSQINSNRSKVTLESPDKCTSILTSIDKPKDPIKSMRQSLEQRLKSNRSKVQGETLPVASISTSDISDPEPKQDLQDTKDPKPDSKSKMRSGRRWRLVPVAPEDMDFDTEQVGPQDVIPNKDVCVLFTNFTDQGDYVNDHDYLINPYLRNSLTRRSKGNDYCVCLLCDYVHPASTHIKHMQCHSTRCCICLVDFKNVFILNLHVRRHTWYCLECETRVTYPKYRHHAEVHNKSQTLSKIFVAPETITWRKTQKKSPKNTKRRETGSAPPAARTSKRVTRSKKCLKEPEYEEEEEEACIFDKETKSFVTPSAQRLKRQLRKPATPTRDEDNEHQSKEPSDPELSESDLTLTELLATAAKPRAAKRAVPPVDSDLSPQRRKKKRRRFVPVKKKRMEKPKGTPREPEGVPTAAHRPESCTGTVPCECVNLPTGTGNQPSRIAEMPLFRRQANYQPLLGPKPNHLLTTKASILKRKPQRILKPGSRIVKVKFVPKRRLNCDEIQQKQAAGLQPVELPSRVVAVPVKQNVSTILTTAKRVQAPPRRRKQQLVLLSE